MISFEAVPAVILPGQRTMEGTRKLRWHPVFVSLRELDLPASADEA